MGYDGGGAGFQMAAGGGRTDLQGGSSSFSPHRDDDATWPMNLGVNQAFEGGPYPERPGVPNCAYYIRTGLCRFGKTCKFNHPLNRKLAAANAKNRGGYPERLGEPECQYYLKTGTCKFGDTCKFHHPRDKAGIIARVQLNILGFPLRPNEAECSYYLRTGQCKFGNTCKFHHPQPSNTVLSFRGSPVYPTIHSPTTHGQQSVRGQANWPRTSFIPSPRWQGPSSYAQVILPQGMVPVTGWNPYSGSPGSVSSPQSQQQATGNAQFYGSSQKSETTGIGAQGAFSLRAGLDPYLLHKENVFPERPGEPECVFYMKTGDCKFGVSCRFHHPRERMFSVPDCVLSPIGLPLRPEEPLCIFYSRYGICKFGPNCKFNHPMEPLGYRLPSTSSIDVPVAQRVLVSASSAALPLTSEVPDEENSLQLPVSEPQKITSGDENSEAEDKHTP